MFYRKKVRDAYAECIRLHPTIGEDLRSALKVNERVPAFIDNLAIELEKVADLRRKQRKNNLTDEQIRETTYAMTDMFIMGLKNDVKRKHESDIERVKREQEELERAHLERTAAGEASGDYKDMGLEDVQDDRSVL